MLEAIGTLMLRVVGSITLIGIIFAIILGLGRWAGKSSIDEVNGKRREVWPKGR